jgi:hypothetical protein
MLSEETPHPSTQNDIKQKPNRVCPRLVAVRLCLSVFLPVLENARHACLPEMLYLVKKNIRSGRWYMRASMRQRKTLAKKNKMTNRYQTEI